MKFKIAVAFFLVGCTTTNEPQLNREKLRHVASDDQSEWAPTSKSAPFYPLNLASRGVEGCVKIEFIVNEQGKPIAPLVTKSIPAGAFDSASLKALRKFRYVATANNSTKTPVVTSNIFTYHVSDDDDHDHENERAYWENKCM